MADEEGSRRQNNLQNVLRLAVTNTPQNPDMAVNSAPTSMDSDRREFLDMVLSDLHVSSSAVKEMTRCLESLRNNLNSITCETSNPITCLEMESTLEELTEYVAQIDHANDFHKIGGFEVLDSVLNVEHEGILCNSSDLIAELVQNNPYCQRAALDKGLVKKLLMLLDSHPNDTVKIKALYALSCIIRQNHEAQDVFEQSDGFSTLLRSMQSNILKLRIKISFLLASLCNDRPEHQDILYRMGFVEQIVALLHSENDESHEHLLSLLLELARRHEPSRKECQREELGLQQLLIHKCSALKGQEKFLEQIDYCNQLSNTCFDEQSKTELER